MNGRVVAVGGLMLLGLFLSLFGFFTYNLSPVSAAATNETALTASVTVQTYVDISLTNISISFGNLNTGVSNSSNVNNPMIITINSNTNDNTNITFKSTDFTASGAAIGVGNMTYHFANDTQSNFNATKMSTNYPTLVPYSTTALPYWTNITGPSGGAAINKEARFYLTVPSGQKAASYTATLTVRVGAGTGA